jgi:bla regulator protein BlaR1
MMHRLFKLAGCILSQRAIGANFWRQIMKLLWSLVLLVLVPFCVLTLLGSSTLPGQSAEQPVTSPSGMPDWQIAAGGHAKFDVASVKQDLAVASRETVHSNVALDSMDMFSPTSGLLSSTNFPLASFLHFAYRLSPEQVAGVQTQLPGWARTNRYDITARAAGNPTKDQMRLMMQALLADRFKFAMHTETRQEPILAMVLDRPGKLGPQLQQHTDPSDCSTATPSSLSPNELATVGGPGYPEVCGAVLGLKAVHSGQIREGARNVPMVRLANLLNNRSFPTGIGRHVADETGLTGQFDFVFEFTPVFNGLPAGETFEADPDGPTPLEALKEQLGIRLIQKSGSVQVVVVDHVEEPSVN